jgi:diguanylate cyclase (GGDEF)-like protein
MNVTNETRAAAFRWKPFESGAAMTEAGRLSVLRDVGLVACIIACFAVGLWLIPMGSKATTPWCSAALMPAGGDANEELSVPVGDSDGSFTPAPRGTLLTLPAYPVWLRLVPDHPWTGIDTPTLVLRNLGRSDVKLYLNGKLIGAVDAQADQGLEHRDGMDTLFQLPSDLKSALYLQIKPRLARLISVELPPTRSVYDEELGRARLLAGCISILVFMGIVGLCFWAFLKQGAFGIYAMLAWSIGLYLAFVSGEGFKILPFAQTMRYYQELLIIIPAAFATIATIRLMQGMLPLAPSVRRLRVPFGAVIAAWFLIAALVFVVPHGLVPPLKMAGNLLAVISVLLLVAGIVPAAASGSRPALLMLLGWLILWFITVARVLQILRGQQSDFLDVAFPLATLVGATMPALAIADGWAQERRELVDVRIAASTDGLTKVMNRRAIEARIETAFVQARAKDGGLSLLFIDIDHFKAVNDSYGHAIGDTVLRTVAERIRRHIRPGDSIGRWGGEEFIVAMPDTGRAEALAIAERIRIALAAEPLNLAAVSIPVTASFGAASLEADVTTPHQLIDRADIAVYQAKREGRNRVVCA